MRAHSPSDPGELCRIVADAVATGQRLELRGGGSKAEFGAPGQPDAIIGMGGLAGIVEYDPAELVLTVKAGTKLSEVTTLVAAQEQMLAFEPFDHGPLFGRPAGDATIGGIVAAGVAGSGRVTAGSVRDHLLGFTAVSGRGEVFVGGAKVVKNVTGYDLPKVMAGSWGRLAAMTEVTLKVLPLPRVRVTLAMAGLSAVGAQAAMARALGSQAEVSAAAHLPAIVNRGTALTVFRLQGFGPSVTARCDVLQSALAAAGPVERLDDAEADRVWDALRTLSVLDPARPLWRVNVPPSLGSTVVAALEPLGAQWLFDWAGGLVWLAFDGGADLVRAAAAEGHATLVRAPAGMRAVVPAQQPQPASVMALSRRVRRVFDPAGVFETGRFLDDADAD